MWPFKSRPKAGPSMNYVSADQWAAGFAAIGITPKAAENIAAVLAAVNAISETIAGLPAYVVRTDDPAAAPVDTHPLARLIRDGVNVNQTWSDFLSCWLASALLRGNALAEIQTDGTGRLSGLVFLPWQGITPWQADTGALRFDYVPTVQPQMGQRRTLLRDEVLFLADRSDNGLIGIPRLQRAGGAMRSAIETQEASTQFAMNAARPSGVLTSPGRIDDDTAKRLKTDWTGNYAADRKGIPAVLGSGLEWKPLSQFSSEDLQIVAHKNFSVADVARVFGVPPFMLADPSRATYASAREATRHFTMLTLAPWLVKIERAFTASVLPPGLRLVLDTDGLTRGSMEDRWRAWALARQTGVLSPNDIRTSEGWPAVPDGNDIAPPNTSAGAAAPVDEPPPQPAPAPPGDDPEKGTVWIQ